MEKLFENWSIENARDVILKYTLPDALKPEYDGMTAYELASIILREAANTQNPDLLESLIVKLQGRYEELRKANPVLWQDEMPTDRQ